MAPTLPSIAPTVDTTGNGEADEHEEPTAIDRHDDSSGQGMQTPTAATTEFNVEHASAYDNRYDTETSSAQPTTLI